MFMLYSGVGDIYHKYKYTALYIIHAFETRPICIKSNEVVVATSYRNDVIALMPLIGRYI